MDFLVDMFGIRKPYNTELSYFKSNPNVAGMATEDNKIILNPYSKNTAKEQEAVAKNEAIRLFMNIQNIAPSFDLTEEQQKFFKGSAYEKDPVAAKQTIISRILSGDPSAKNVTEEQMKAAKEIEALANSYKPE